MSELPDAATFSNLMGECFRVQGEGEVAELRLEKVTALPSQPEAPRQEPYSLQFALPEEMDAAQGVYTLENDQLGIIDLFLVPVGRKAMEAIVN